MILKQKTSCLVLVAASIGALLVNTGCGDDDANVDGGGSDDDSGFTEESPPPPPGDAGRDASEPPPEMDAGRDASEPPPPGHDAGPDASEPTPDASEPDAELPLSLGGLTVSTTAGEMEDGLDLFGAPGHRFWIEVNDEQLERLNGGGWIGPGPFPGGGGDRCNDRYCPGSGDEPSNAPYADHVLVQDVETEDVADYGKLEIDLVGQSTGRQWTASMIPNVRFDTNEFVKGKRIGTFEHFRLNNSLVGSIFREHLAHDIYRALGYPGLRSSHAFLGSNVWGDDVWVPMTLIETYKRRFCHDNQDLIGGDCENMYEFASDIGGWFPGPGGDFEADADAPDGGTPIVPGVVPPDWCQVSECDDTRLAELMGLLSVTPRGAGFKQALADYIDWDRFHQFQCLSWMLWTGDDAVHGGNNTVLIQRDDGKFVWAPYSVDISIGQDWYTDVELTGYSSIPSGCQSDPDCWADTIMVCEDLILRFDELNPEEMVDDLVTTLTDLGMMRYGDEARAEQIRAWLVDRQAELSYELEQYRVLPDDFGNCPDGYEMCGDGGCGTPEDCQERQCNSEQFFCESYGYCVYSTSQCPDCEDEAPFFCDWTASCVADQFACRQLCDESPEYEWCATYEYCAGNGECPDGDDAGVGMGGIGGIGGAGGAGGAGGIGMGGGIPLPRRID